MNYRLFLLSFVLIFVGCSTEQLSERKIERIIAKIDQATEACNFDEATRLFTDRSSFYTYRGDQLIEEARWPELREKIKRQMQQCKFATISRDVIAESIEISKKRDEASHSIELVEEFSVANGPTFRSHTIENTLLRLENNEVKILETTLYEVDFKEID